MDARGFRVVGRGLYDPFKLHVYIRPEDQNQIRPLLEELLLKATSEGVIPGYKIYKKMGDGVNKLAKRNTHWGNVIYLPMAYTPENCEKVIALCRAIQTLIEKHTSARGEFMHLQDCDLRISDNISFRCSTLDPEEKVHRYYGANRRTAAHIMQGLKKAGEQSKYYQHLKKGLAVQSRAANSENKLEKKTDQDKTKTITISANTTSASSHSSQNRSPSLFSSASAASVASAADSAAITIKKVIKEKEEDDGLLFDFEP